MLRSHRPPSHSVVPPAARRGTVIALVAAAVAVLAAGCGGGSTTTTSATTSATTAATTSSTSAPAGLSADQVLAKARAAAAGARSVHIVGHSVQGGRTTSFDLKLTSSLGAVGSIELGGGKVEIVRIGGDIYHTADAKTLASGLGGSSTEIAKVVAGRFIKGPLTDPRLASFTQVTSLKDFISNLLNPGGAITRVDGKPVNGVRTVGLLNDDKAAGGTLYIAAEGTPFPLLIEALANGSDTGTLQMKDWNAGVTINAPPPEQVIDLSRLGK